MDATGIFDGATALLTFSGAAVLLTAGLILAEQAPLLQAVLTAAGLGMAVVGVGTLVLP